ncbi:MAG TPA: cytochrome c [Phycisphaerae bacterium]|nr:cytochrome c [Phycisphaerae bacterium]
MKASSKKFFVYGDIILLALIPLSIIALKREQRTPTPRLEIIQDLDKQAYLKPLRESALFADDRGMRPQVFGTLAQEDMVLPNIAEMQVHPDDAAADNVRITSGADYDSIMFGQNLVNGNGQFVSRIPIPVTPEFIQRGQEEFNIFCTPCHGYNGKGDGTVNEFVNQLRAANDPNAGTWVEPTDLTSAAVQSLPDGMVYNIITNGIAAMASYRDQIQIVDRWAIVAYVRSLEMSQKQVPVDQLPRNVREQLNSPESQ